MISKASNIVHLPVHWFFYRYTAICLKVFFPFNKKKSYYVSKYLLLLFPLTKKNSIASPKMSCFLPTHFQQFLWYSFLKLFFASIKMREFHDVDLGFMHYCTQTLRKIILSKQRCKAQSVVFVTTVLNHVWIFCFWLWER